MKYEMLVGLEVLDDLTYSAYRKAMTPLLETYGGGFRYDFKVGELLKVEQGAEKVNRVFTIFFNDIEARDSFFSNPNYLEIKEEFFEKSVGEAVIISEYTRS